MERCPYWACLETTSASTGGTEDRCLPRSPTSEFCLILAGCRAVGDAPQKHAASQGWLHSPACHGAIAAGLPHAESLPLGCGPTMPSLGISCQGLHSFHSLHAGRELDES